MAQKHSTEYIEKPMTRDGRIQGPSRRYRRLRHPIFPATEWTAKNPLLQRGEIGAESDTHKIKVGDGLTYWNDLPYMTSVGQPLSTANYQMGNSSGEWTTMTQAQQDALNSGATATNIGQISTNTTNIGNHIADTNNPHSVTKTQVGLGNVDNTSDIDKPISTATQNALDLKANSADLGTAAYTASTAYATAAQGTLADTAVQPGDLATVATTGSYADLLNKPTIPAAQVNSDWNANSGVAQILNKPTIPTVNDPTITITQGGVTKGSFSLNQASGDTIALDASTLDPHRVIDFQEPTAQNNYTWYRKYADGWVEQGGRTVQETTSQQALVLPVTMADANYQVLANAVDDTLTAYAFCVQVKDKTTTGFNTQVFGSYQGGIATSGYSFDWQVSGMTNIA